MAQQGQLQQSGSNNNNSNTINNAGHSQQQSNTSQATDPHFARLQEASRTLSARLELDRKIEQVCSLAEAFGAGSPASGDYIDPHIEAWSPFRKTRTVNLPDELFEKYDLVQSHFNMGLLPEIERAWLTVDHRLFLWDYKDGSGFTSFEEVQEVILAVALVKPKPGILIDTISHLLVLSTTTAVHLIGLSPIPPQERQPGYPPFQLYLLDLSVSTGEGRALTSIVGTRSGRIFGCSTASASGVVAGPGSGDLYELVYNAKEGLFSKRAYLSNLTTGGSAASASWILPTFLRGEGSTDAVEQVVLDHERDLLYTRTSKNTIELWNLQQGKSDRVASLRDLHRLAGSFCQGHPLFHGPNAPPLVVVGMEIVNLSEGKNIGLIAVASTGVRLYFSYQRGGLRSYNNVATAPTGLELVHVRLPPQMPRDAPAFDLSRSTIPSNGGGFFLSASPINDDDDLLLLCAPDIGRIAQSALQGTRAAFIEYASRVRVEGRAWAIAEAHTSALPGLRYQRNELQSQITSRTRREWLFLTNMGMHVVSRQRPIDTLHALLEDSVASGTSPRDGGVGAFANAYGQDQTCAMLIALLAESSAFTASGAAVTSEIAFAAKQALASLDIGGRPTAVQRGLPVSQAIQTTAEGKVLLSPRHEGLAWYFARLVEPLIERKIIVQVPGPQVMDSAVSDRQLMATQRDLNSLRNFLDANTHLFSMVGDQYSGPDAVMAYTEEQKSVHNMRLLLTQTVEAISFVLLLIDYKLPQVVQACPPEVARSILEMTWADLLASSKGRDAARSLVNAIINIQLGQSLSIDAISDVLQQRCGSFCSADDVLLYKAIENIRKAKSGPPSEKMANLRESLRFFIKAASHLSSGKLSEVLSEFNALSFQTGSIDLAFACASAWDRDDRGLSWWRDGQQQHDSRAPSWEPRSYCYDKALEALESADALLNKAVQNAPRNSTAENEAKNIRSNAYSRALASQDEAFHHRLYEWHLKRGLSDQLLDTRTPYLEVFLLQEPATLERYDLLWQYYARQAQHSKAASVLATLADSNDFDLSLEKRLEYLSLASSNAKSQFPNAALRQDLITFLTEVEEKIEVAGVQVEICGHLQSDIEADGHREAVAQLQHRLFSISELYSDFAEPFRLYDMMLLIYHVSDYRDTERVIETWTDLIDQVVRERGSDAVAVLASKVSSLGRRFYPSDVAMPIPIVIDLLERFSLDHTEGRSASQVLEDAWVPNAFHDGGIPWEVIFEAYDEIIDISQTPWHDRQNLSFLLAAAANIVSSWLQELSLSGGTSSSRQGAFPANNVSRSVERFIDLASADKEVRQKLQTLASDIHAQF